MRRKRELWALPPAELPAGGGRASAVHESEADGTWRAWVSWVQETGGRHVHKVVQVRAASAPPAGAARGGCAALMGGSAAGADSGGQVGAGG